MERYVESLLADARWCHWVGTRGTAALIFIVTGESTAKNPAWDQD